MRIRLGLRIKFFLYSNTVIAVTMFLVAVISVLHERSSRQQAIDSRGRSIVEVMAISISEALEQESRAASEDHDRVDHYLAEVLDRNRDLMRDVVVTDSRGIVTHANREGLLGKPFPRARPVLGLDGLTVTDMRTTEDGEDILEVRSALLRQGRALGSLAVDFSLGPIEQQVQEVAKRAALVAFVLMLFNSALTAAYVENLIRPILYLNRTMKRAGRGDLAVRAAVRRGDEVGELSDAFDRMMDELEEAHDRETVQRAQLAHTEKMAAVGTLAAGVAHEVNNPLAGVLACIENMRADPDNVQMREQYLDLIEDGLKRIERTVANLLNFSRQREIRPEPTSINHNLRHVVELVGYQLRNANIEVRFELTEDDALVMADHFQMEQLFLNLVLNAMQSMPGGGTLNLRTRLRRGKFVAEVGDTGVGIPDVIRERIFDPFFTTREVGEGTGLGLAVSDSIVAAHGGTLEVESALGEGSTFRVTFDAMPIDEGESR